MTYNYFDKLSALDGTTLSSWHAWLSGEGRGCCSLRFAEDDDYVYSVVVGWHDSGDGWKICWAVKRQTHDNAMQCDMDVDFELPYSDESGDVDDTLEEIEVENGSPVGCSSWDELAERVRSVAGRVAEDWLR